MFSIPRPNVTQYCNPYIALTYIFNPALNKLQWKDHGGARPAPFPVVTWLWKRTGSSDAVLNARYPYFKISQRRILFSEFMSRCLGVSVPSMEAEIPESVFSSVYLLLPLLMQVPVPSSWPTALLTTEIHSGKITSTRQGYLLFTPLNVFSSFVQCPCFPIIKSNCSLNPSLSPWLLLLHPPRSNHFPSVSTAKSPPAFPCYHSLPVNSPRSNDPFMSSLPWWKIPSCPADLNGSFCPVCCAERWFILQGFAQWLPGSNGFWSLSPKGKWEAVTSMWKPHSILWAAWALAVILLTWTGLWNSAVPGWLILGPREVKPQHWGRWLLPSPIW